MKQHIQANIKPIFSIYPKIRATIQGLILRQKFPKLTVVQRLTSNVIVELRRPRTFDSSKAVPQGPFHPKLYHIIEALVNRL